MKIRRKEEEQIYTEYDLFREFIRAQEKDKKKMRKLGLIRNFIKKKKIKHG